MRTDQQGIAWKDCYRLGDEKVDGQHRMIFELLSGLISSCLDGSSEETLKAALDFLVNYTVQHFYDEESLQVQYNFPEYRNHKRLHEDFKASVIGIVDKFGEEGSSAELSGDLSKIVVRWLVTHVTREDKKVGEFIREKERRLTPYANAS